MIATVEGYEFPLDRRYEPREHLWVLPEGSDADGTVVRVGVDALGLELLGEVVYVELVEAGAEVGRGEAVGSLEAEKMIRPVVAPVSGRVLQVNAAVLAAPRLLNQEPYRDGWLFRIRATRWEAERPHLLGDEIAVRAWARAEIEANR